MNIIVNQEHGRRLQHVAWLANASDLEHRIWLSFHGQKETVTFNITPSEYRCLVQTLQNKKTILEPEKAEELLRMLDEYALPILVEEAWETS